MAHVFGVAIYDGATTPIVRAIVGPFANEDAGEAWAAANCAEAALPHDVEGCTCGADMVTDSSHDMSCDGKCSYCGQYGYDCTSNRQAVAAPCSFSAWDVVPMTAPTSLHRDP